MKTHKQKKLVLLPATLVFFLSLHHVYAQQNLIVFGDSLSDGGNIGRYTYDGNQHLLYDEIIANHLKDYLKPSGNGGFNYAQGGATAVETLHPGLNTQDQLTNYLHSRGGHADSNGMYIHWVGANDIAAAATTPARAQAVIKASSGSAASQVKTLLNAGAGLVIVPNIPQLGLTPYVVQVLLSSMGPQAMGAAYKVLNNTPTPDEKARHEALRQAFNAAAGQVSNIPEARDAIARQLYNSWLKISAQISGLTDSYNQLEDAQLKDVKGNIARMDIAGLFREVIANPEQYGLNNTLGMACPLGESADHCHASDPGFSKDQHYLFADRLHPSPEVHRLMAEYMQSVLEAPEKVAQLSAAAGMMNRDMHSTLDGHLQLQRIHPAQAGKLTVFGGYAGERLKAKSLNWIDASSPSRNLSLGLGYQFTDNLQSGILLSQHNHRLGSSNDFNFWLNGNQAALYSQFTLSDQAWIDADLHYAWLNYNNIKRQIHLGPATRTENGNSKGNQTGMRVQAGWNFSLNKHFVTGPISRYSLTKTQVKGYREDGNASTTMRFADQTLRSQIGSFGWQIEGKNLPVNPWIRVLKSHQFGDTTTSLRGGLKLTGTGFTRVVNSSDKNWIDTAAGINIPLGKSVNAYSGISTVSGKRHYHPVSWNAGFNVAF